MTDSRPIQGCDVSIWFLVYSFAFNAKIQFDNEYTLLDTDEEYFLFWTQIGISCKADTSLHLTWNAKHLFCLVENNYPVLFEYADFGVFITLCIAKPGYGQICDECLLGRSFLLPDSDELTLSDINF